ncbi:hypothetical protein [Rheinheimera maricola]|uniref:Uncharacterized protein n=1 Tax=Rheinheimera maricola TaxID=2793282 RepID=A0ABS7XAD3_9GAMM|nr:hypothetical protein [Rheinheimera maricola]MBZ9612519.1 hypothetical protein [Rheinheimera maricola]
MLPMKLYEILPYGYVAAGSSVMLSVESWLALVSGLLIMIAGAVIWVLRSDNRRSDMRNAREKYGGVLPFWLYELLPFSYFILALLLFSATSNMYVYPSAMILMIVGLQLWLLRGSYRKHSRPKIALRPVRYRS